MTKSELDKMNENFEKHCDKIRNEEPQEPNISPSGLILIHDGQEYPVMLDRTNGYKFTCKEATDEEFPDSLCLMSWAAGPINLELKVDPEKAEEVRGILKQEIQTYKKMVKDGEDFIINMQAKLKKEPVRLFPLGAVRGGQIRP